MRGFSKKKEDLLQRRETPLIAFQVPDITLSDDNNTFVVRLEFQKKKTIQEGTVGKFFI